MFVARDHMPEADARTDWFIFPVLALFAMPGECPDMMRYQCTEINAGDRVGLFGPF